MAHFFIYWIAARRLRLLAMTEILALLSLRVKRNNPVNNVAPTAHSYESPVRAAFLPLSFYLALLALLSLRAQRGNPVDNVVQHIFVTPTQAGMTSKM